MGNFKTQLLVERWLPLVPGSCHCLEVPVQNKLELD